jgi:hypothetical protein
LFEGDRDFFQHFVAAAVSDAVQYAAVQMSFQDTLPHLVQGGFDRANLDQNLLAGLVLPDL